MALILPRFQSEHVDRFFETARMIRDGRQNECDILALFFRAEKDLLPCPNVQRVWDETQCPLKALWACYESSRDKDRQEMYDKIIAADRHDEVIGIAPRFWDFDVFQWGRSMWRLSTLALQSKTTNSHRASRIVNQWDLLSPMGKCHDRDWLYIQWPRARYGLGWLWGDHSGEISTAGNTQLAREGFHFLQDLAYTQDYRHWNDDGYEWGPNNLALHAETFGGHSLRVMLAEYDLWEK